jgi:hypothetical protein
MTTYDEQNQEIKILQTQMKTFLPPKINEQILETNIPKTQEEQPTSQTTPEAPVVSE